METRFTFREAFETWWNTEPPNDENHVAISALFDLQRQVLPEPEKQHVLRHLTTCLECTQTLKDLFREDVGEPIILIEVPSVAAQSVREDDSTSPLEDANSLVITEDVSRRVQFLRHFEQHHTYLSIEVKRTAQQAFEGRNVEVYNTQHTLLCQGQLVGGAAAWCLDGEIIGRLVLKIMST